MRNSTFAIAQSRELQIRLRWKNAPHFFIRLHVDWQSPCQPPLSTGGLAAPQGPAASPQTTKLTLLAPGRAETKKPVFPNPGQRAES